MRKRLMCLVVAVFFLSTGWTIRNLGTLPGGLGSYATGINEQGYVVGAARHPDGEWRAVFWKPEGGIIQIPTTADRVCCDSYAHEINDGLTVVGEMPSPDGRFRRAFLWKPFAPAAMELPFGRESRGFSVNNFGDTVGWGFELDWSQHALLWRGGSSPPVDIGSLGGGFTEPRDVGDGPVIVGWGNRMPVRRPIRYAFLWISGRMRDLGTLGGDNSEAYGVAGGPVEDTIYVVGKSEIVPGELTTRAFLWHGGTMMELPTIKGCDFYEAHAINRSKDIVGLCGNASGESRALLWRPDGSVIMLNDLLPPGSGWTNLSLAFDINESGQIVGTGVVEGELHQRAFVMTP